MQASCGGLSAIDGPVIVSRVRVVHIISGVEPENGGPTAALCGMVRAQQKAGVTCEVLATWKSRTAFDVAASLESDGIPTRLLGPTRRPFRRHPDSEQALREAMQRCDIAHIHAVWEDIEARGARIAREMRKPYFWTPHGMIDRWNMKRNRLFKEVCLGLYLRASLNGATALHVASAFERDQVSRLGLRPPVVIKGFGVDPMLFQPLPLRGQWRSRHEIALDTPVALFLGRIQRGKGLEHLIPMMGALRCKTAILVVAGPDEGGYQATVMRDIERRGLSDRVRFVGTVRGEEKVALLHDADILAAPSRHENFGIAVAEALAVGTAVLVSDQVGLAPQVLSANAGVVSPLVDRALAEALDGALSALQTGRFDRSRIAQWAATEFCWSALGEGYRALYEQYASSADRAGQNA